MKQLSKKNILIYLAFLFKALSATSLEVITPCGNVIKFDFYRKIGTIGDNDGESAADLYENALKKSGKAIVALALADDQKSLVISPLSYLRCIGIDTPFDPQKTYYFEINKYDEHNFCLNDVTLAVTELLDKESPQFSIEKVGIDLENGNKYMLSGYEACLKKMYNTASLRPVNSSIAAQSCYQEVQSDCLLNLSMVHVPVPVHIPVFIPIADPCINVQSNHQESSCASQELEQQLPVVEEKDDFVFQNEGLNLKTLELNSTSLTDQSSLEVKSSEPQLENIETQPKSLEVIKIAQVPLKPSMNSQRIMLAPKLSVAAQKKHQQLSAQALDKAKRERLLLLEQEKKEQQEKKEEQEPLMKSEFVVPDLSSKKDRKQKKVSDFDDQDVQEMLRVMTIQAQDEVQAAERAQQQKLTESQCEVEGVLDNAQQLFTYIMSLIDMLDPAQPYNQDALHGLCLQIEGCGKKLLSYIEKYENVRVYNSLSEKSLIFSLCHLLLKTSYLSCSYYEAKKKQVRPNGMRCCECLISVVASDQFFIEGFENKKFKKSINQDPFTKNVYSTVEKIYNEWKIVPKKLSKFIEELYKKLPLYYTKTNYQECLIEKLMNFNNQFLERYALKK